MIMHASCGGPEGSVRAFHASFPMLRALRDKTGVVVSLFNSL